MVAQSLDQAIAEAKKATIEAKGPQRTVFIRPDKREYALAQQNNLSAAVKLLAEMT